MDSMEHSTHERSTKNEEIKKEEYNRSVKMPQIYFESSMKYHRIPFRSEYLDKKYLHVNNEGKRRIDAALGLLKLKQSVRDQHN